jgi:hypothetical protein
MLNSTPVFCPDPRICYCEVYEICFERAVEYEEFFVIAEERQKVAKELDFWKDWDNGPGRAAGIEEPGETALKIQRESKLNANDTASWTRGDWLDHKQLELLLELDGRKKKAFEDGRDTAKKAAAIDSAGKRPLMLPENEKDYPWWL